MTDKENKTMDNKIIEEYITFGIDNGYKIKKGGFDSYNVMDNIILLWFYENDVDDFSKIKCKDYNIIELITSKPFTEAIARGLRKEAHKSVTEEIKKYNLDGYNIEVFRGINYIGGGKSASYDICTQQSIAIRDGELENFITQLLGNKN